MTHQKLIYIAGEGSEEQSIRLSDDEREEFIRDNTRKVYLAATRASQCLVFTYVGDLTEMLKQAFNLSITVAS